MHASSIVSIVLPALPFIAGSGVPIRVSPGLNVSTNPNVTAHLPPCTDLAGSHAPTIPCSNTLGVSSYLVNYNLTSAEICAPYQSLLGTCLLPTVYGAPGVNCTMVTATESSCIPFDCVNLTSTACPAPTYNDSAVAAGAQAWYAVYNVYSVHRFVLNWATALNATSSQTAIIDVVKPRIPNTATMVMVALISKHGINKNADTALINMLQIPTKKPQPTYGNGRLRGESSTLPASMWQPHLVARLQDALQIVMDDFNDFISTVGNGTFSTNGLASAKALKKKMAGTSASGNASMVSTHKTLVSAHKATASLHASDSPHSLAAAHVIPSPHTTRATLSTHTSASTLATVSARRPEGESTGP